MRPETLVLLVLLPTSGEKWKTLDLAGLATLSSPVVLRRLVENGDGRSAPKGLKYWMAKDGHLVLEVQILPADPRETSNDKTLTSFSDAIAKPGGGQKTTAKWVKKNGHVGLDYTYKNSIGLASKHRAYCVGDWILDAGVSWKGGEKVDFARVNKFLSSFAPAAKK